jgi:hypothetical protein
MTSPSHVFFRLGIEVFFSASQWRIGLLRARAAQPPPTPTPQLVKHERRTANGGCWRSRRRRGASCTCRRACGPAVGRF